MDSGCCIGGNGAQSVLLPLPGPGLAFPGLHQGPILTFVNTGFVKGLINFLFQGGDNEF